MAAALFGSVSRVLYVGGSLASAGAVIFLALLPQSAAQMFVWPWCIYYVVAAGAPWLAILGRALAPCAPLRLPRAPALVVAALVVGALSASQAVSPFRSEIGIWLAIPLAGVAWTFLAFDFVLGADQVRRGWLHSIAGLCGGGIAVVSLLLWASKLSFAWTVAAGGAANLPHGLLARAAWALERRNDEPLGHANYTAGLALLVLPWLVSLVLQRRGRERLLWLLLLSACIGMGITSGSRGGLLGVAGMGGLACMLAWSQYPQVRRRLIPAFLAAIVLIGSLALAHPGMRARLKPRAPGEPPNLSNVERAGMLQIAWQAGMDRPMTGWGIGSVPLFYDRYRGTVDYGTINALQVHSLPFNLWAEGGAFLCLGAAGTLMLATGAAWRLARARRLGVGSQPWAALVSAGGYTLFALTDYQLDLPIVGLILALNLGVLGAEQAGNPALAVSRLSGRSRWLVCGLACVACLAVSAGAVGWLGARAALADGDVEEALRRNPADTVVRIVSALDRVAESRRAGDEVQRERLVADAVRTLEVVASSGIHREIAHFNLGWLYLSRDPAVAREHFNVVLGCAPSKAGAWFGLGLARKALGDDDGFIDALAMECLAQPAFVCSGWWTVPPMVEERAAIFRRLVLKLDGVGARVPKGHWPEPQARYFSAFVRWLQGEVPSEAVAAVAASPEAHAFFDALEGELASNFFSVRFLAGLASEDPWALGILNDRLASLSGQSFGPEAAGIARKFRGRTLNEAARIALAPSVAERPFVVLEYSPRVGFGVRQRNPYAQRVRDAMPQHIYPPASCFASRLLPAPGWLFDGLLLDLARPTTRFGSGPPAE